MPTARPSPGPVRRQTLLAHVFEPCDTTQIPVQQSTSPPGHGCPGPTQVAERQEQTPPLVQPQGPSQHWALLLHVWPVAWQVLARQVQVDPTQPHGPLQHPCGWLQLVPAGNLQILARQVPTPLVKPHCPAQQSDHDVHAAPIPPQFAVRQV